MKLTVNEELYELVKKVNEEGADFDLEMFETMAMCYEGRAEQEEN